MRVIASQKDADQMTEGKKKDQAAGDRQRQGTKSLADLDERNERIPLERCKFSPVPEHQEAENGHKQIREDDENDPNTGWNHGAEGNNRQMCIFTHTDGCSEEGNEHHHQQGILLDPGWCIVQHVSAKNKPAEDDRHNDKRDAGYNAADPDDRVKHTLNDAQTF